MDISVLSMLGELTRRVNNILDLAQPLNNFIKKDANAEWNRDDLFEECNEAFEELQSCRQEAIESWLAAVNSPDQCPSLQAVDRVEADIDWHVDVLVFNWRCLLQGYFSPDGHAPEELVDPDPELRTLATQAKRRSADRVWSQYTDAVELASAVNHLVTMEAVQ